MKIIRSSLSELLDNNTERFTVFDKGSAIAIGNFDGIHLGHQYILSKLNSCAEKDQLISTLITFEPYPIEFFQAKHQAKHHGQEKSLKPFRIMSEDEKKYVLNDLAIDCLIILDFNHQLAAMSAHSFIEDLLIKRLSVKQLLVGKDFRFGNKRQGDVSLLRDFAKDNDFNLVVFDDIKIDDGHRVSSTMIRQLLHQGDIKSVNRCLDRPYTVIGKVIDGDKRGRTIGFPTANIFLQENKVVLHGVYVVQVGFVNDSQYAGQKVFGICNIGHRPTYRSSKALLEVHLFDWSDTIYGETLHVSILQKVRDEMKFNNIEELKDQISKDVEYAKAYIEPIKNELENCK